MDSFLLTARRFGHDQRGITGLETAIILIAFVVVASVFAYTVLSAGIFSSEKSKETIHVGIDNAESTMELVGEVKGDGTLQTMLTGVDTPSNWATGSSDVTLATETDDVKGGTAAIDLTVGAAFGTGLIAYEDLSPAVDLTSHYVASLWIKSDASLAASVLELVLDDNAGCGSPTATLALPALTATTWVEPRLAIPDPSLLGAVACVGIRAASDPGAVTLTLDLIQGPAEVQQVHLTLAAVIKTVGVPLVTTTDSNSDGLLSDESTKNHVLVVSYLDQNQVVHDLAWTTTALGRNDGDVLLETGEKVLFTIDLTGVSPVPGPRTPVTFQIRPEGGAALVVERVMPANISTSFIIR